MKRRASRLIPKYFFSRCLLSRCTYTFLLCGLLLLPQSVIHREALAEGIFLDAVVASVDGKPITVSDVSRRMKPPVKLTLQEAANNGDFSRALDIIILEHLIELEAGQRKISVVEDEIKDYMKEIAERNNLSPEEFIAALKQENLSEEAYRQQIKSDILRSKLASSLVRGTVAVSDSEIEAVLKGKRDAPPAGKTITLRQILISFNKHSDDQAKKQITQIQEKIEDGEKFDELATNYSESPDSIDGGLLGVLKDSELNSAIFEAIQDLDIGEVSDIVKTDLGYHLFLLEDRSEEHSDDDSDSGLDSISEEEREKIRSSLKQEKLESKMGEFFTTELFKLHSVDRNI